MELLWFHTVDGRNPANQLRLIVYPIIHKVLYIPGGTGFLPSTVSLTHLDHFSQENPLYLGNHQGEKSVKSSGELSHLGGGFNLSNSTNLRLNKNEIWNYFQPPKFQKFKWKISFSKKWIISTSLDFLVLSFFEISQIHVIHLFNPNIWIQPPRDDWLRWPRGPSCDSNDATWTLETASTIW